MLCLISMAQPVLAQADSTAADDEEEGAPPPRKKYVGGHQLTIGFDIFDPVMNNFVKNRYSYEGEASWYLKNEYYAVAEGGWGGSEVTYNDLRYNTTNTFARIGFNKSVLYRDRPEDWDMMFVGLRVAGSNVSRGIATYTVTDSTWGTIGGSVPAKDFTAIWAEITAGMRVELVHGLMAGWNARLKFLMNGRSFDSLAPLNIAGFGRGDKTSSFALNLYVDYAIRWKRKNAPPPEKK